MRGSKGYYTGTRSLLKKATRDKGKPHIGKILEDYAPGSQVITAPKPMRSAASVIL